LRAPYIDTNAFSATSTDGVRRAGHFSNGIGVSICNTFDLDMHQSARGDPLETRNVRSSNAVILQAKRFLRATDVRYWHLADIHFH